jgi:hypothetical protein
VDGPLFRTQSERRHGADRELSQTIDVVVASARRADQRFQRLERRTEHAVTALRDALGERGRGAAADLLEDAAEAHLDLIHAKEAALEAQRLLGARDSGPEAPAGR